MKSSDKFAQIITTTMATWSFIIVFLVLCLLEIWTNHLGIFSFDPQTIILNLILSLIAAVQGSIIMIAQKQSDAKSEERAQETHEMVKEELSIVKEELALAREEREMIKKLLEE